MSNGILLISLQSLSSPPLEHPHEAANNHSHGNAHVRARREEVPLEFLGIVDVRECILRRGDTEHTHERCPLARRHVDETCIRHLILHGFRVVFFSLVFERSHLHDIVFVVVID